MYNWCHLSVMLVYQENNGPKSLFAIIQVKLVFFLVALLYCLTSTNYYETYFQKILTLFLFNHNHIIYITNMYILHTVSLHFYQQITNVLLFFILTRIPVNICMWQILFATLLKLMNLNMSLGFFKAIWNTAWICG